VAETEKRHRSHRDLGAALKMPVAYCVLHNIFALSRIMERTAKIEAKTTD